MRRPTATAKTSSCTARAPRSTAGRTWIYWKATSHRSAAQICVCKKNKWEDGIGMLPLQRARTLPQLAFFDQRGSTRGTDWIVTVLRVGSQKESKSRAITPRVHPPFPRHPRFPVRLSGPERSEACSARRRAQMHQPHAIPTFSLNPCHQGTAPSAARPAGARRRAQRHQVHAIPTFSLIPCQQGTAPSEACKCTSSHAGAPGARDPDIFPESMPSGNRPERSEASRCTTSQAGAQGARDPDIFPKSPRRHS